MNARVSGPLIVAVIFLCLAFGRFGGQRVAFLAVAVIFVVLALRRRRNG